MKRFLVLAFVIASALAAAGARPQTEEPDAPRTIAITAKRFEFVPPEITVKRGETVRLLVTSQDVTHGFFQRALKIDSDLEPGKTAEVVITPPEAGTFTVICHNFCGSGHGSMKLKVLVE
ncbi:MAG TPA: cupredoxin domain-containing protein [Thermoanaerobaculia bacterium]|nr:cupredoxin domain-containing protein [Thermoanaerobaculia bacterium]